MKTIKGYGLLAFDGIHLAHGWTDDTGGPLRLRASIYKTRAGAASDAGLGQHVVKVEVREVIRRPRRTKAAMLLDAALMRRSAERAERGE